MFMKTACVKAPLSYTCRVSQTRFFKLYGCYLLPFTPVETSRLIQLKTKIVFTIKEIPAYIFFSIDSI